MRVNIGIENIKGLELEIRSGLNNTFKALFKELEKDIQNFGKSVVKAVANSPEFAELMTDPILRAQLGMPRKTFRLGSDTDGEDLLEELAKFIYKSNVTGRTKQINITFPTLKQLEDKLQRNLSKIGKNSFKPGPRQSWFKWWEYGNSADAEGFTLTLRNLSRINPRKARNINDIIRERSRSGFGLQVDSVNSVTVIEGRHLISKIYSNYGQIFPAYIATRVKRFFNNNRYVGRFFSRGRTS